MEDIIRKLLDNKVLSGVSLGAVGSLITIIVMVYNNILGLSFFVMIGVFGLFALVVTIFSIRNAGENNNNNDETSYLRQRMQDCDVEDELLIEYIDYLKTRPSLLEHSLFNSEYRKFKNEVAKIEKTEENKGKAWIITRFLNLKLDVVIERLKVYIGNNLDVINNDFKHLGVNDLIVVVYDSINSKEEGNEGYEIIAEKQGVPKRFITQFNLRHDYIVSQLDAALQVIKTSNYFRSDYIKISAVLDAVLSAFKETFSEKHINEILSINGELEAEYAYIADMLGKGLLT